MKNKSKKIKCLVWFLFGFLIVISFAHTALAAGIPAADMTYNLLSPLPGTGETFDPTQPNNLGTYLNAIIPLFIGLCVILSVIMIVIGGLQYMTSELISSKEEGKAKIRNAVFGLLLALGAWVILYTINPNLLKIDLSGVTQQDVTIQLMPENESVTMAVLSDGGAPSGATAGCPEGIGRASGISVCNRIVSSVNNMIAAARSAGCNLTGGGYRSPEAQKQLRIQNCHGDYTSKSPSPPCDPMTALPGASRHQQGLAIDFQSSGTLIQSESNNCFVWLKNNARQYGLSNLRGEPWHWSTDGN